MYQAKGGLMNIKPKNHARLLLTFSSINSPNIRSSDFCSLLMVFSLLLCCSERRLARKEVSFCKSGGNQAVILTCMCMEKRGLWQAGYGVHKLPINPSSL
jgi:hypothetical protein